ncbi:enoyl-CoA hydratase-related protein [Hirschia maritima]|uniref:enoyl-CoA hydratase-related protein n=1 Tax=Hirschia maritima TaxID=1121961 RepID=UPI0003771EC8|nr:enoyl-CoA hydratase-related protein [Hirschia maritima]
MAAYSVTTENGITHITFTRPEVSNAMGQEFWSTFATTIRDLNEAGKTRVCVVSAEGKNFCSGMELSAFSSGISKTDTPEEREAFAYMVDHLQDTLTSLEKSRFPVIAAVQGACVGAGLDFVSACDLIVASEEAYFRIEEINIGMMADVGSLQRLPKLMPEHIVRELAYLGSTLTASDAKQYGFVNDVCADKEATLSRALEMATIISKKAPIAIAGSKRAITYARDHSTDDALRWASVAQAGYWKPSDIMQAVQSRMTKTDPNFEDPAPINTTMLRPQK